MRSSSGRAAAITLAGLTLLFGASVAMAEPDPPDDPGDTTEPTITTSTTSPTSPTSPPVSLIADADAAASRSVEPIQVASTPAPPSTTSTTTLPPEHLLPANSGDGRRVVYRKAWPMRVWLVDDNDNVVKSHLVSGRSTWNQPTPNNVASDRTPNSYLRYYDHTQVPAYYEVLSRSAYTCNINNPNLCWRYMVRFTKGPGGDNIGFHEIPSLDGRRVQSDSQLGQALSGGCVRQSTSDAQFMWNWAGIGTKVVVIQ